MNMIIKNTTKDICATTIVIKVDVEVEDNEIHDVAEVNVTIDYQSNADHTEIFADIINMDKLTKSFGQLSVETEMLIINHAIGTCRVSDDDISLQEDINNPKYGEGL